MTTKPVIIQGPKGEIVNLTTLNFACAYSDDQRTTALYFTGRERPITLSMSYYKFLDAVANAVKEIEL